MVVIKSSRLSPSTTPVDQGYAWIVLASCTLLRLLSDGVWSSLGVLMVHWEDKFDVSASQSAWIGSMFMFILLSSGEKTRK